MKANRLLQGMLLAAALLLALPAAQAKRPADDGGDARNGRGRYDTPAGRDDRQRAPRYDGDEDRRGRGDDARRYEPRRAVPGRGLSDAVREAERRTGGQVLSAEQRNEGGRPVYRVKVLTPDGRVRVLYLDAR